MSQSPLDRIGRLGYMSAPMLDLLSVAFATNEGSVGDGELLARKFFDRSHGLKYATDLDVMDFPPDTEHNVRRILAAYWFGKRAALASSGEKAVATDPDAAAELFRDLRGQKQEHFAIAMLDTKNQCIAVRTIHIGTLDMSVVGARDVFREAIRENAASIILAHNHPSGDPAPSREDIEITTRLVAFGKELDIPVLDHIIIGDGKSLSLKRLGKI